MSEPAEIDSNIFRKIVYILVAAVLFKNITALKYGAIGIDTLPGVLLITSYFFVGLIFFIKAITDIRLASDRVLIILVSCLFILTFTGDVFAQSSKQAYNADFKLFSLHSAQGVLNGQNPYTSQMPLSGSLRNFTPQLSGMFVDKFSYPALGFLIFVPQVLLGLMNISWTVILFFTAIYIFLVDESPDRLKFLPLIIILANGSITSVASQGNFTPLWVLPLLFSMKYWKSEKLNKSAIALGIAFAFKQVAWFIAPFLAIWLYKENNRSDFLEKLGNYTLYGGATFFGINLPFIIASPVAWAKGVFTPLGSSGSLYPQGMGLSLLNSMGVANLPNIYYHLALLMAFAVGLTVYYLNFDRFKWAAWTAPLFILWFNYRSLSTYFSFFILVGYYCILLKTGNQSDKSIFDEARKLF